MNKRRYVNQEIWRGSPFWLYVGVGAFALAVSCMFLTVGIVSGPSFLLYAPLLAAVLLLVGGYYESNPIPRAIAWLLAWIVIAATGLLAVVATGRGLLLCGGLLLLPTIGIALSIWRAIASYRQALNASTDQMLIDLVELRREVTFAEADEELKIGETAVLQRAGTLFENGLITGAVDPLNRRLYSLAGLAAKQAQIASVIQARGQMKLPELSAELQVPEQLLRDWLYQLVRLDRFSGYVDWAKETVYSQAREQLLEQQMCPGCTAELSLAGQGIIGCEYCGVEIFL